MSKHNLKQATKGRIFGLSTYDGREINARVLSESPCYVTVWDNNRSESVRIAKSNIFDIRCGG